MGKGAQVYIENNTGGRLSYDFHHSRGLSSDTQLQEGRRGTLEDGERLHAGYLEGSRWSGESVVDLTLEDEKGVRWNTRLSQGDHWYFQTDRGVEYRRLLVLEDVHHGDLDDIVMDVRPAFALQTWMGDAAAARPSWRDRKLSDLALFGTHDSATYAYDYFFLNPVGAYVKTQDSSITEQLNSGVRFLDLRLGWHNDRVEMFHDKYELGLTFEDAIGQVNRFLDTHDDEVVLASVKIDHGDAGRITPWLSDAANAPLLARMYGKAEIPTYAEAKGSIVFLNRGVSAITGVPLEVPDNAKYHSGGKYNTVQDAYEHTKLDGDEKARLIRDFYDRSMRNGGGLDPAAVGKYRANYLNAVKLLSPATYAERYNPILLERRYQREDWSGIFIVDSQSGHQLRSLATHLLAPNFLF